MSKSNRLYMTLNRASEWRRALLDNLIVQGHCVVTDNSSASTAVMITGSCDSTEFDFIWRSLLIDASLGDNIILKTSAYAANTTIVTAGERTIELDSFLSDNSVSASERISVIDHLFKPLTSNCKDVPVNLCGRYIWIKLEFIMLESRSVELRKLKLLLNSERISDYLPEIYRIEDGENGFLSRFMSIFDSLFFEMDDAINDLSSSLDYRAAKDSMLKYLAEWISVEDTSYLTDDQLRQRIKDAISEHRSIGVKKGIVRWIESEVGVTPNIIEYFDVRGMVYEGKDRETYQRLFGDNPFKFFVVLPEGIFADVHEANHFMQQLKKRIPAYTEAEIILAKDSVILDDHTYLGSNTTLGDFTQANIGAANMLSHDLILGGAEDEQ